MTKEPVIDAHIHLDQYEEADRRKLLDGLQEADIRALVAVSTDLASAHRTLELARQDSRIRPAIGFHPEQPLPSEEELGALLQLIDEEQHRIAAVGEVGLPWYMRLGDPTIDRTPYEEVLSQFIRKAVDCGLPIALHAVYKDAETVCELLELHSAEQAHFHWYKGSDRTLDRIITNGWLVSVTPEVVYRPKIQHIARRVPLAQLMVETDGPWPFEGPFTGQRTDPRMLHASVMAIAGLKQLPAGTVYRELLRTTERFYGVERSI
ncbi:MULTISPECIES: TatD family hydrolase [Sporosarcina]|uniref:TatD family hydrolase n=1 Tax=Sporosarcina TaxID=1569 RepID=UPI00058F2B52|nr:MULTISPECIES: TatD family hydrolase [Sporosarcina]WJY26821.1 TatD family hydrolase [Sporosarcina sp. 0.2-SM1T-5]